MEKINSFTENYSFLDNAYLRQMTVSVFVKDEDGDISQKYLDYPSVWHAWFASQTTDPEVQHALYEKNNLSELQEYMMDKEIRPNWPKKEREVMEKLLRNKFESNLDLKILLVSTKDYEISGDSEFEITTKNFGNHLVSELLTKLRAEYLKEEGTAEDMLKRHFIQNGLGGLLDRVEFKF